MGCWWKCLLKFRINKACLTYLIATMRVFSRLSLLDSSPKPTSKLRNTSRRRFLTIPPQRTVWRTDPVSPTTVTQLFLRMELSLCSSPQWLILMLLLQRRIGRTLRITASLPLQTMMESLTMLWSMQHWMTWKAHKSMTAHHSRTRRIWTKDLWIGSDSGSSQPSQRRRPLSSSPRTILRWIFNRTPLTQGLSSRCRSASLCKRMTWLTESGSRVITIFERRMGDRSLLNEGKTIFWNKESIKDSN